MLVQVGFQSISLSALENGDVTDTAPIPPHAKNSEKNMGVQKLNIKLVNKS